MCSLVREMFGFFKGISRTENICTLLPSLHFTAIGEIADAELLQPIIRETATSSQSSLFEFFSKQNMENMENMELDLKIDKSEARYCCQVCGDLATCYR